jgi:hypothetical protein
MSLETKDVVNFIKKQPVLVVCVGISLALGALLYFRSDALDQQTQAHNDKKDEDERLRKNIEYASKLPAQLLALQAANKEVQARAVHPRELSLNLQYFYRIESETGVKDQGGLHHGGVVKPTGKAAPKTVFLPDAYTVTVQGDFRQLVDLLRHIEQGSHFSRELNAIIAPASKEDPSSTKLTLALNLELLALPAP